MLADIELLKKLVVTAGDLALKRCGTVACEYKQDLSIVTDVDRETERFLEKELKTVYPDYAFVGEEYGWRGEEDVPVWACDPIDGTTNYFFGMPFWGVSVGLLKDGVPELGAFYMPQLQELFWAERGKGAWCNGTRMTGMPDKDDMHLEDPICMTSNALKTLNPNALPGRLRSFGSIASELAYTARGNVCGIVGRHEGIVDIAATLCMCFETGCEMRRLSDGQPVDIAALTLARRTEEPFIIAKPRKMKYLLGVL